MGDESDETRTPDDYRAIAEAAFDVVRLDHKVHAPRYARIYAEAAFNPLVSELAWRLQALRGLIGPPRPPSTPWKCNALGIEADADLQAIRQHLEAIAAHHGWRFTSELMESDGPAASPDDDQAAREELALHAESIRDLADRFEGRTVAEEAAASDWIVCQQADVARVLGRSVNTPKLVEEIGPAEGLLEFGGMAGRKYRVRMTDPAMHARLRAEVYGA